MRSTASTMLLRLASKPVAVFALALVAAAFAAGLFDGPG